MDDTERSDTVAVPCILAKFVLPLEIKHLHKMHKLTGFIPLMRTYSAFDRGVSIAISPCMELTLTDHPKDLAPPSKEKQ